MTPKKTASPKDWLPIGQRIRLPAASLGIYTPRRHDAAGEPVPCSEGTIVEHLLHGAVAVKCDGYANTVDYSAREAMHFTKFYDLTK